MNYLPTRNDLGSLLPADSVGAEIGVWRGYNAVEMLQRWPIRKLYLVDPWRENLGGYVDPLATDNHESNYKETVANVKSFGEKVEVIRDCSSWAARFCAYIEPLDFCYLDAGHSFDEALTDLRLWSAKMKLTGLLMGHDFVENEHSKKWGFDVIGAVTQFCKESDWELTHLTQEETPSFVLERRK